MKLKLKAILAIIPAKERSKLNKNLALSLVNAMLDLLSVALVIPLILVILDKEKLAQFLPSIFNNDNTSQSVIYLILAVVLVFTIKNIVQLRIVKQFFNYIFGISTQLSVDIAEYHLQSNTANVRDQNISEFYHNIRAACVDFSSKILFSLFSLVSESFVLLVLFVSSLWLFPLGTSVIFAIGLVFSYVIFAIKKRGVMNYNEQYIQFFHENTDQSFNLYNGKLDIILNQAEDNYLMLFRKSLTNMNEQLATAHYWRFSNTKILELFAILFLIGGVVFYINFQTNYDPFLISFFGAISFKFLPSFIKLLNAYTEFKAYGHTIETIEKAKGHKMPDKEQVSITQSLELRQVSFGYGNKTQILNTINFKVQQGEIIGIQGNSGIGKTTLLKLIAGMNQANSGDILIDDERLTPNQTPGSSISYVSQTPYVFKGTVLNNVIINRSSEEDIGRVNKLIDLFELRQLLESHPDGLNRVLSSDDQSLSTGQKQRLAFIRALYTRPTLLLLDEATSHIEPQLAAKIFSYLKKEVEKSNMCVVSVSHNPELNKYYGKRYVLNYEGQLTVVSH